MLPFVPEMGAGGAGDMHLACKCNCVPRSTVSASSRIRAIPKSALSEALGCPSHQRTWISCYAAPDRAACAAFFKESRIEFDNATNLDRKSGVPGTMMMGFHCFRRRVQPHLLPRQKQWLGFARLFHPTYAGANVGHPLLLSPHRWWRNRGLPGAMTKVPGEVGRRPIENPL